MVEQAGKADTPRARVDQYLRIHFDHYAAAMQGKTRPLAILSEMRALEGEARAALMQQYQAVFRGVRAFFGPADTAARKLRQTASTPMLNEVVLDRKSTRLNYSH